MLKKIQAAFGAAVDPPERGLKTLEVTVDGRPAKVEATGWKRRAVYAPIARRDLRVATQLYLRLATPIDFSGGTKTVAVRDGAAEFAPLTARTERQRLSPAIHVNQEGYVPTFPKKAMRG